MRRVALLMTTATLIAAFFVAFVALSIVDSGRVTARCVERAERDYQALLVELGPVVAEVAGKPRRVDACDSQPDSDAVVMIGLDESKNAADAEAVLERQGWSSSQMRPYRSVYRSPERDLRANVWDDSVEIYRIARPSDGDR